MKEVEDKDDFDVALMNENSYGDDVVDDRPMSPTSLVFPGF